MEPYENFRICKKCGSYIPGQWSRCGRCGHSIRSGRSQRWLGKLLILCLLALGVFYFKDEIRLLFAKAAPIIESQILRFSPDNEIEIKTEQNVSAGGTETAQDELYKKIENALRTTASTVKISAKDAKNSDRVFSMIQNITLNDPDILFYESCSLRSDGLLTFNYSKPKDFILKANKELDAKADKIVKTVIKPGMSEFEKELALHDYIVNHTTYDVENYEKNTIPPESHSAYGALIDGKAVCEGYAKALKLLFGKVGLKSYVVSGDSKGQSHAWNIVQIDGAYYQIDATWDDPVSNSGEQTLQHTYFNLTDKEMSVDHQWNKSDYPACSSNTYNYYYYLKKVVTSPKGFISYVSHALKSGEKHTSVRIADYTKDSYPVPGLIQTAAIESGVESIYYSINESFGIVEVWIGK